MMVIPKYFTLVSSVFSHAAFSCILHFLVIWMVMHFLGLNSIIQVCAYRYVSNKSHKSIGASNDLCDPLM